MLQLGAVSRYFETLKLGVATNCASGARLKAGIEGKDRLRFT